MDWDNFRTNQLSFCLANTTINGRMILLKNIFRLINTYWGDIVFYSILPFFLVFYSQASKDLPLVDGHFIPVVDRQQALLLFFLYIIYAVVSLVRIILFQKRLLRDWSYLVVGIVTTLCFAAFLSPSKFVLTPISVHYAFSSYASALQNISVGLLQARIAIGLYKFFKVDKPANASEKSSELS